MAKKKISAPVVVVDSESMNDYDRAHEKAKDPNMSTAGNPLAEDPAQGLQDRIVCTNMERLYQDARMRRGPNGHVYAGIMNRRFGG